MEAAGEEGRAGGKKTRLVRSDKYIPLQERDS